MGLIEWCNSEKEPNPSLTTPVMLGGEYAVRLWEEMLKRYTENQNNSSNDKHNHKDPA